MWPLTPGPRRPGISRDLYLAGRPARAPQAAVVRNDDGAARVTVPVRAVWPFRAPAGSTKTFELDEIGLFVWDACDGDATMLELIEAVAARYRLTPREAEVSTTKFVEMLLHKRLLVMTEGVADDAR